MDLSTVAPWAILSVAVVAFLWLDLRLFARGHEPSLREGLIWSIGWLVLSLAAALVVWVVDDGEAAVLYTTVYVIERSLSLDNLVVFLIVFAYFGVPTELRPRLLFWGIAGALVLRALAILGGIALINALHFVLYLLAVLLLALAYRIFRGVEESVDPDVNVAVRVIRRVFPVTGRFHGHRWFVSVDGTRSATPLFLCLGAIIFADIAFAIDSIPAAFAITRESFLIWMGNVFALLGLRALFVLVEGLLKRFRYFDETIAIVLGVVAVKLLLEDVIEVSPIASLVIVAGLFAGGIVASLIADARDPEAELRRREREERVEAQA